MPSALTTLPCRISSRFWALCKNAKESFQSASFWWFPLFFSINQMKTRPCCWFPWKRKWPDFHCGHSHQTVSVLSIRPTVFFLLGFTEFRKILFEKSNFGARFTGSFFFVFRNRVLPMQPSFLSNRSHLLKDGTRFAFYLFIYFFLSFGIVLVFITSFLHGPIVALQVCCQLSDISLVGFRWRRDTDLTEVPHFYVLYQFT